MLDNRRFLADAIAVLNAAIGIRQPLAEGVHRMQPRWRVFVVAPDASARNALTELIERELDLGVVGEGEPRPETAAEAIAVKPDILIVKVGGSEQAILLCRDILSAKPHLKCLIVAAFDDEGLLDALLIGASDYVREDQALAGQIADHIRHILSSDQALDTKIKARARGAPERNDFFAGLSEQQLRLALLVTEGLTNAEIAEQMGLSVNTVRNYLSHLMTRLKVRNRTQLAVAMSQMATRQRKLESP